MNKNQFKTPYDIFDYNICAKSQTTHTEGNYGASENQYFSTLSIVTTHPVTCDHLEGLSKLSLYWLKRKIKSIYNFSKIGIEQSNRKKLRQGITMKN